MSSTHFTDKEAETWVTSPAQCPTLLGFCPKSAGPKLVPQSSIESLFKAFVKPCLSGKGIRTVASTGFVLTFCVTRRMDLTGE